MPDPLALRIAFVLMAGMLAVAAWCDLRTRKVPNWLTLPAAGLGLAFWTLWGALGPGSMTAWQGLLASLGALLAGFLPSLAIYALGGLGGGDVKTLGALGALSGSWEVVLATAFYGLIVACLWAIALMLRHRIVGQTLRNLVTAGLAVAARTRPVVADAGPTVPLGAAFKVGGLLAGVEHMLRIPLPWSGHL